MSFFSDAVETLKTLVTLIGVGLGLWGAVNLMEGYGADNPGAKSQGMKQFMSGAGIVLIGQVLVPKLSDLFTVAALDTNTVLASVNYFYFSALSIVTNVAAVFNPQFAVISAVLAA
ncbi:hypothetical protein AGMMS49975_09130 [Clostridia bacterium]|nr:hypothetical protein AGMMS49975_09130 [Clostridia bacterium]